MSDENTISGSIRYQKDDIDFTRRFSSKSFTQTGVGFAHNVQDIGDVHEALDMGNVTSSGAFAFFNNGSYNIQIGIDQTGVFVTILEIPAKGFIVGCYLDIDAPYAKCTDSTGASLEYFIAQR